MAKPAAPSTPPPAPSSPGRLGEKIEHVGQRILAWVFDHTVETLSAWIGWALELFMHALRPGMLRVFGPYLRHVRDQPGMPTEMKDLLNRTLDEDGEAASAILGAMGTSAAGGAVGSIVGSLMAPATYAINRVIEPARLDPSAAFALAWRTTGFSDKAIEHLRDVGWGEPEINAWKQALMPRPGVAELLVNEHRSQLSPVVADIELRLRGYQQADIDVLRTLSKFVPGPADLVRMGLREAWRDDVAAEWGYDSDFPPELAEWMKRQGDVDGWAHKYWRAHWDLPGLSSVLDMLYRVPEFTTEDLDTYLRISDIPATWRDYLKRTAYRPLTRVDVRRMYGMGVLDQAAVKKSYLDLGYDETNATHMTEFTVRYETETDREATKSDILSFYKVGSLTATEATDWLQAIGYPGDLAAYLVSREQMKAEQAIQDQQKKHIRNFYIHAEITVTEASARLASIGVPAGEINTLLEQWQMDREAKVERPSRATLDKLFRQDVVSQEEYTTGLDALGYQPRYVDWYLDSILQIKTEEARKEDERARGEQESIRTRRIKSDYQVAKASLDVDLAEVATAIAETQLALRARQLRYQDELRMAREAVPIAELREIATSDIAGLEVQIGDQEHAITFLDEQIEALETQIADIKLRAALEPPEITPEDAVIQIRERQLAIEFAQDDIAGAHIQIADLRNQILARRVRLEEDLRIAVRVRTIEEIEVDWRVNLAAMAARIDELRVNLSELREQKALLAVEYREGLVVPH